MLVGHGDAVAVSRESDSGDCWCWSNIWSRYEQDLWQIRAADSSELFCVFLPVASLLWIWLVRRPKKFGNSVAFKDVCVSAINDGGCGGGGGAGGGGDSGAGCTRNALPSCRKSRIALRIKQVMRVLYSRYWRIRPADRPCRRCYRSARTKRNAVHSTVESLRTDWCAADDGIVCRQAHLVVEWEEGDWMSSMMLFRVRRKGWPRNGRFSPCLLKPFFTLEHETIYEHGGIARYTCVCILSTSVSIVLI